LILDAGPLGCPVSGGHGHADLLAIQCVAFGEPYLVDPGTHGYGEEGGLRRYFRSTAAHSTVMVDGRGQAEPDGPFSWRTRPAARLLAWSSGPETDLADAEHHAYARPGHPLVHRRRVLFRKPLYWIVVDEVGGAGEHEVGLRFQFAPLQVSLGDDHWVRARGRQAGGLLVRPFAVCPLSARVRSAGLDPIEGWVSPRYGQKCGAPLAVFTATGHLPLRIVTLLFPIEDAAAPAPRVRPLFDADGVPCGLAFDDLGEAVRFTAATFTVESLREAER
jgi:hypothetical protein